MIELEIKSNTKKQKKNKNSIEEAIDEGLEKAPFLMEDLGDQSINKGPDSMQYSGEN